MVGQNETDRQRQTENGWKDRHTSYRYTHPAVYYHHDKLKLQRSTQSASVQRINLQVTRTVLTERSRRQTALCVGFANLDGQTFPAHARHQLTAMQCITTVSSHGSTADTNNV